MHAGKRCGFFSDVLSHIHSVAASVLEGQVGLGGSVPKGPRRSILLVPEIKEKSGWFSVWRRVFTTAFPWTCGFLQNSLNFWSTDVILIFFAVCSVTHLGLTLCNPACNFPSSVPHYLPKFVQFKSIALMMPSHPLKPCPFYPQSPSIRDFSIELAIFIRWPKYWGFIISPSMSI